MSEIWQNITLSHLHPAQWKNTSYLYHWLSGSLREWRQSSFLMQWAETIGFLLVALVFALSPFVSNTLIGLLLIAGVAFWVLLTLSDESLETFSPIHLLVLAYWGIAVIATALSPVKAAALTGLVKLTLYLLFFTFMARVLQTSKFRKWLIAIYLHISLIVSIYGIRQWIAKVPPLATWNDPGSVQAQATRAYSYLGNPNLLGAYLIPAIALSIVAIFAWKSWATKALAVTMFLVNASCLRYTGSRGAWIAFVALIVVMLLLMWYWWKPQMSDFWQKWSLPIALGSLLLIICLALIVLEPLRDRFFTIFAGRGDSSNNFRINVWLAVIEMIKDRPFLGIGPGNNAFNKVYPIYQKPKFTALSAYSILLEIAVETGIIGLCTFIWLLIVTVAQGIKQLGRLRENYNPDGYWIIAALAGMAGLMAQGFVDTVWYRPEVNTLWWLMVAIIASYYQSPNKRLSGVFTPV